MNLVLIVFAYLCCRSIARDVVPRSFFDMFLEKNKLKDDSSNNADWVHDLSFILVAAQKNYVLDAPLGADLLQEQMQTYEHFESSIW